MFKKRILLADADAQELSEFRQALGDAWVVSAVADGNAALALMEEQPQDVLVADLDLAEVDGVELLNRIQTTHPKTIRFILANELDHERMMKQVLGSHRFLSKPLNTSTLKGTIERTVALDRWVASNNIRELVARIRTLPTIPSLYLEVIAALKSPNVTTEQVSGIIAKDMAMMTKLLLVINSAGFGLSRKITNPSEAVGLLGFETVKSMVMTIKLLSQYDKVKPVYFSIDKLWRHSTDVARTAKALTMMHTDDPAMAEMAFTAGLMHDLGKVVLASNFDEQYRGAQSLARKQGIPLWEVEKEIFGASHGEIGAYLLGLWGMPLDLLEVSALHHQPSASLDKSFTPLTAVHVANVLEHELNPDKEGWAESKIDGVYLAEVGALDYLDAWRNAVATKNFSKPEPKARSLTMAAAKAPAAAAGAATRKPSDTASFRKNPVENGKSLTKSAWVYWSVSAAVVILLMAWLGSELLMKQIEKPQPATTVEPKPALSASTTTTAVKKAVLDTVASVEAAVVTPVAARSVATNAAPVAAVVAPVKVTPRAPGFSDLKLQGVFSSAPPSAIVSGQTVHLRDRINGALVVSIASSSVTLEYNGERKTLVLR